MLRSLHEPMVSPQKEHEILKAFQLSGGLLSTTPTSQASTVFGFPGGAPAISANGSTNAIVWVLDNSAFATSGPAVCMPTTPRTLPPPPPPAPPGLTRSPALYRGRFGEGNQLDDQWLPRLFWRNLLNGLHGHLHLAPKQS